MNAITYLPCPHPWHCRLGYCSLPPVWHHQAIIFVKIPSKVYTETGLKMPARVKLKKLSI